MQIEISTRHGHLGDQTRAKIADRVEKLTRIFDRLGAIEVTVDLEHPETPSVDLRLSVKHKHDFVATNQSENLMAALDGVIEKMEQQLRKHKEKVQDRHRSSAYRPSEVPSEAELES